MGEKVEAEKDRLLEVFLGWSKGLISALGPDFFSDYIDPCSGLPMVHKESQTVYDEVGSRPSVPPLRGPIPLRSTRSPSAPIPHALDHPSTHPPILSLTHPLSFPVPLQVSALSVLRGYKCSNAGCCKVVLHPNWGSFIYPATLVTTAPLDVLLGAIGGSSDGGDAGR